MGVDDAPDLAPAPDAGPSRDPDAVPDADLAAFWEERYAGSDRVWSGKVNPVLAEVAAGLPPGRVLDLACGEGGDVVWLARQGWTATGVDLSPTAIEHGRAAARAAGIPDERVNLIAADVTNWSTAERFDLVTISFLHSWPFDIPRERIIRAASTWVAGGGDLLVTSHAEPPPWANPEHAHAVAFPTPDSELAALSLDVSEWSVIAADIREREGVGPGGIAGTLRDTIIHARRVASS